MSTTTIVHGLHVTEHPDGQVTYSRGENGVGTLLAVTPFGRTPNGGEQSIITVLPALKYCDRHPEGTDLPCGGCANARSAYDAAAGFGSIVTTVSGPDSADKHDKFVALIVSYIAKAVNA